MIVTVDEPRQYQPSLRINYPRTRGHLLGRFAVVSDPNDSFAFDSHRFGPGSIFVDGVDTGIADQQFRALVGERCSFMRQESPGAAGDNRRT